jgi:CRP-like cAMP-binding protein
MDKLVKLAYSMTKKTYPEGSVIFQQGEKFSHIVLLNKGELVVKQTIATGHTSNMDNFISGSIIIQKPRNGKRYKHYPIVIDIAELRHYDVFGLVEYTSALKKYKRQLVAKTMAEVFFIPSAIFKNFLDQEPSTAKMIEELSLRRMKWEAVRRDFGQFLHYYLFSVV